MQEVHEQRMIALARGNDVRTKRARLKQKIAACEVDARELLTGEIPEYATTMSLSKLLVAVPKVGRVRANKIIQRTCRRDLPLERVSPCTRKQIAEMLP